MHTRILTAELSPIDLDTLAIPLPIWLSFCKVDTVAILIDDAHLGPDDHMDRDQIMTLASDTDLIDGILIRMLEHPLDFEMVLPANHFIVDGELVWPQGSEEFEDKQQGRYEGRPDPTHFTFRVCEEPSPDGQSQGVIDEKDYEVFYLYLRMTWNRHDNSRSELSEGSMTITEVMDPNDANFVITCTVKHLGELNPKVVNLPVLARSA